tara:strand:- start:4 stop:486 length:483 start_codon:yes stop_codon:yes gene_type:complete
MCYACQNPFTASTDEKSVWINEYEKWAESSTNYAKEIFNEIVDNGEDLMETQYCECGEEECDPEAESDDDSIDIDDVEDADEETDFKTKLAEYRERKKKVADTFELIPSHEGFDGRIPDLYKDIETGRTFDLEENEYHEHPHIGWIVKYTENYYTFYHAE